VRFRDDFDGPGLDRSVWIPHYLPTTDMSRGSWSTA